MAFSDAVEWWEGWQLRILALSSLFIQVFLSFSAPLRKYRIPAWFRFFIWLAYLGGDAMAIYALATLFNRHKNQEWKSKHSNSTGMEALWAPILLAHLGGQDSMTAYNIEDNELWRRHVLTALSQITVAIYVFYKSWTGEKKLLLAAIFLFAVGIMKCIEKPWSLKSASINSLVASSESKQDDSASEIDSLENFVQTATEYFRANHSNSEVEEEDEDEEGGIMQGEDGDDSSDSSSIDFVPAFAPKNIVDDQAYNLFIDLACPFSERLDNLKYMVHHPTEAQTLVKSGLSKAFDRLYTKDQVYKDGIMLWKHHSKKFWLTALPREIAGYLAVAAIVLFHKTDKEAYNGTDVKVTYILMYSTILMAVGMLVKGFGQGIELAGWVLWPAQISQYNLIGYLARNKKHSWVRKLATLLVCKDNLDQLWCMEPRKSSWDITMAVRLHAMAVWKYGIADTTSYRHFQDIRGQWTLLDFECTHLEWSLRMPFDESVLLWHLATDFCFYHTNAWQKESVHQKHAHRCRTISNYMAYLLFVNPEMLMAGARRILFRKAYREIKDLLKGEDPLLHGRELTEKIIELLKTNCEHEQTRGASSRQSFVRSAWGLANALVRIGNDERMWRMIQGVWLEMLCFSARRCRGYLHAKSLGKGGEYLSHVWLLLSYMGMATSAEILQRTELQDERDMGANNV